MKTYTIENETNNITVHATAHEIATIGNADRFHNEASLVKLAADWPTSRLVEIWNSLPGVTPVNKFKDKTTAVSRIWKALETLYSPAVETVAEESACAATAGEPPLRNSPDEHAGSAGGGRRRDDTRCAGVGRGRGGNNCVERGRPGNRTRTRRDVR
jgi:hypothetical protein